ncbi:THAP domain-containing protein 10-like [Pecten maximus]|uniref:THAP domain-containing protein 10-like n=1 Tax=Pecten maximus TaxID=6579 RepID=UPI0014584843|nr:THAP domain-containing protein 10-like [Pecten maximus]
MAAYGVSVSQHMFLVFYQRKLDFFQKIFVLKCVYRYKMPHHCCVPHCTNNSKTKDGYSFHTFPKDPSVAKKWVIAIRRDQGADFNINKETRVCSVHFNADSYHPTTAIHVRKRLRGSAVPSVFQWTVQKPVRRKLPSHEKSKLWKCRIQQYKFPRKNMFWKAVIMIVMNLCL